MDESLVFQAVEALQQHHGLVKSKRKPQLVEDNPLLSLVIALRKIPDRTIRPHRIPLPHLLYPADETEMCLFSKSDKKSTKELLEAKKVKGVTKVIPMNKLQTNYKTFESKRQLSSLYDLYLTDKRLYHLLPRMLGKKFMQKKKFPIPVDMRKGNLAEEFQRARDSTYLHLGLGSCLAIPIGRINHPVKHTVANITSGMTVIATKIPRGWRNIQSVHIKTVDSISLPLYNSLPLQATLLPDIDEGSKRVKRVRLESPEDSGLLQRGESPQEGTSRKQVRSSAVPTQVNTKKVKAVGKVSSKKIKGSTVISSKYERALKKRRRTK